MGKHRRELNIQHQRPTTNNQVDVECWTLGVGRSLPSSGASAIWCKDPPDLASGVKEAEDLDVQPGPTSDSTDARSVGVSLQQNADAPPSSLSRSLLLTVGLLGDSLSGHEGLCFWRYSYWGL